MLEKSLPRINKFVENYIPKDCDKNVKNEYKTSIKLFQKMKWKLILKFYFSLIL